MKLFHGIRRFYGNLKLRNKLFLLILIAVALPIIILAASLSGRLYRMIASDTIREEQIATAQTAPLLEEALSDVKGTYELIRNTSYGHSLFDELHETVPQEALLSERAASFSDTCRQLTVGNLTTAVRIYVDVPKDDPVFSELPSDTVFASMDTIRSTYWYGIFYGSHPSEIFCPPLYLGSTEKKTYGDCAFIRPVYMRQSNGSSTKCYMACYFSSDTLESQMTENLSRSGSVSYITNSRDAMVATTDSTLSGIYYMNYEDIQTNLMSSNGFLEKQILNENVYVSYYYLPTAGWFLVTVIPSAPLAEAASQMMWTFILTWLVAAVISILISMLISNSISKRITAVSEQMSHVKSGPPVPMESPEEIDEIGNLVDSYNYLARQINTLMEEQKKASEELRVAEFNSLQAQINPHFLYNTMEMINWMAMQGRTRETNQAIRALSRFYKLTLSRKNSITTISEEIEHVTIYAELQNMRFENGIDFVVDVPDHLTEYQIPRLTLQPVVENAILHGILEKPDHRGTIVITGWLEDDTVVLLISDDGVGISPEKLPHILTEKVETTGKGNHIAVYNTHRRLQILYGSAYGMHYSSTPGQGTEVEIRLPANASDTFAVPAE